MSEKAIALVVDDSATNIQILAACIKQDYRVKVATSGEQCLLLAQKLPQPDVILLDIEMPGMNGYDTIKALKQEPKTRDIPVIFVTGRESNEDEELGLSLGAMDYITKPIHPAIVRQRVATHVTLKQQRDKLTQLALRDQLTNLYNRHYLLDIAAKKFAEAKRHQHLISVLMLDIDHFKQVNDTHGHAAGDKIIKCVANILSQGNRQEDVVARFGGEEFVVILDHCDAENAKIKAEKLRAQVEQANPEGINLTISIGLSEIDLAEDQNFDQIVKRADDALYQAKEHGRNQVIVG